MSTTQSLSFRQIISQFTSIPNVKFRAFVILCCEEEEELFSEVPRKTDASNAGFERT